MQHGQPDCAELVPQGVRLRDHEGTALPGFLREPKREQARRVRDGSLCGRTNLHEEVAVLHREGHVLHAISVLHQVLAHL